jgi:hypothetical protein
MRGLSRISYAKGGVLYVSKCISMHICVYVYACVNKRATAKVLCLMLDNAKSYRRGGFYVCAYPPIRFSAFSMYKSIHTYMQG